MSNRGLALQLGLSLVIACSGPDGRRVEGPTEPRTGAGGEGVSARAIELEVAEGDLRRIRLPGEAASLQALTVALEVDRRLYGAEAVRVRAVQHRGQRIEAEVRAGDRLFRMTTRVTVDPTRSLVTLRTQVLQFSGPPGARTRVADIVKWHGGGAFAPGTGRLTARGRAAAPWVAFVSGVPAAIVPAAGQLRVRLDAEDDGRPDCIVTGGLRRGAYERRVVLSRGSLADLADRAWAVSGQAVRHVRGVVRGPLRSVVVRAIDGNGMPEALASPEANGAFELTVRPGRFRLLAQGPTGTDEEEVDATADAVVELVLPEGARLRLAVSDGRGAQVPARVVVRGVAPTPDPDLGPDHRADGALQSLCLSAGTAEISLAPGRYSVAATHGLEWSVDVREIELQDRQTARLDLVLRREVETPGLVPGDFHLHADPSRDSLVSLDDRVRSLLCEGVELAVPTDHNHITDYAPVVSELGVPDRIGTVPGVEITTHARRFGHFNAYPVDRSRGPMPFPWAGTTPTAIFRSVRSQFPEAVIQVNHPRSTWSMYFRIMGLDARTGRAQRSAYSSDFDAIEVWNGHHLADPSVVEGYLSEWMSLLDLGHRYTAMGNSDSHRIHPQWPGYPRSYLRLASDAPADVRPAEVAAAVKGGRVVVTNGPLVDLEVDGVGPGGHVRARNGRVSVRVRVQAASWIETTHAELWVDGELRQRFEIEDATTPGPRGEWTVDLRVRPPAFIIAMARGERITNPAHPERAGPPLGFTNPVFVE